MRDAIAARARVLQSFLADEQEGLAAACHALARALSRGGTLIAAGRGSAASDAAHVAVEFLHPVIVGKRALPAVALPADAPLSNFARADDVLLVLAHGPATPDDAELLADGRRRGLLTLAMTGPGRADADFAFAVADDDPAVVQEVHETAYHVLWELVHVFFEHPGLLEEQCLTCGDVAVEARVVALAGAAATVEREGSREEVAVDLVPEDLAVGDVVLCHAGVALERVPDEDPTAFLYPFLGGSEDTLEAVLADVRSSTVAKGADTVALRAALDVEALAACAAAIRSRLQAGGRLLSFGNGGSATDAQDVAHDARARGWPALALTDDPATVTAVANDVGFENAFSRQLIALGTSRDVALAISTSGSSPSVVAGLEEARRRGMLTVALVGYDGGRAARLDGLDHALVVRGDYIPRLQEAQATAYHLILDELGSAA